MSARTYRTIRVCDPSEPAEYGTACFTIEVPTEIADRLEGGEPFVIISVREVRELLAGWRRRASDLPIWNRDSSDTYRRVANDLEALIEVLPPEVRDV